MLWSPGMAFAQPQPVGEVRAARFCSVPEAMRIFTVTVRQALRAQHQDAGWPVFQVPCDPMDQISDASPTAIVIVDLGRVDEQTIRQYSFKPFDKSAQSAIGSLGFTLKPPRSAVPSIWIRGDLGEGRTSALRLAAAAGAVQALAGLKSANALCSADSSALLVQLLAAAVSDSATQPGYLSYFKAALHEQQVLGGQPEPSENLAQSIARDLISGGDDKLRCDVGHKDLFSLSFFGPGETSLSKAAEHIAKALAARKNGASDLTHLNLARACVLQTINDMLTHHKDPSCNADDYGLWVRAYVPLLHAAEVKVLQTSR